MTPTGATGPVSRTEPTGTTGPTRSDGSATPPRPRHRLAWILAALLGAVFVALPAAWQAGAYGVTRTGTLHGSSGGRPVTALHIAGGGANITVSPRGDEQVGYRADLSWSRGKPDIAESWHDGALTLTPRCPDEDSWLTGALSCSILLRVTVPAGLPVTVTATAGRVDIGGLGGAVEAQVDTGRIRLTGLRGTVRARIGSGMLNATALTSPEADLHVGSGRAVVDFTTPPDRVRADIGDGRLALTVPEATVFRVTTSTGWGRNEVEPELSDPASPRTLDLSVGSGRIAAGYPRPTP
ncbi:hypothetical protein J7F03_24865 [Streptomyces sp. ISL-43]|uniref:hypothetical protein n=1 Tax=Streptomyces sp. ISL-43 TaxID=2819183 RepID=UPI001BECF94A|nr:hypothetical protein [Streptomyces sp. ISL-43]MBT2450249.1 hypothetical protein [Streptomyces sp. ISL-43]